MCLCSTRPSFQPANASVDDFRSHRGRPEVDGQHVHSCSKVGHSCLRNIISFKRLPGRSIFRTVGRGLRLLLTTYIDSWTVSNLTDSAADLKHRYFHTKPIADSHICKCLDCGKNMSQPGFASGDAGQAYEAMRNTFVEKCILRVFRRAGWSETSDKTITVAHGRRFAASLGGRVKALQHQNGITI